MQRILVVSQKKVQLSALLERYMPAVLVNLQRVSIRLQRRLLIACVLERVSLTNEAYPAILVQVDHRAKIG